VTTPCDDPEVEDRQGVFIVAEADHTAIGLQRTPDEDVDVERLAAPGHGDLGGMVAQVQLVERAVAATQMDAAEPEHHPGTRIGLQTLHQVRLHEGDAVPGPFPTNCERVSAFARPRGAPRFHVRR